MLIKPPPKEFTEEMQKQNQDAGGNPGNEIEVTPEMIEAGMELLSGGCVGSASTYELAE